VRLHALACTQWHLTANALAHALTPRARAYSDKLALDVLKSADWDMEARARSVTWRTAHAAAIPFPSS
jgi:hypothetical protein